MLGSTSYHPMFRQGGFKFWYPTAADDGFNQVAFGHSSLEGGDVLPIGNGTVLIGASERTQTGMIEQLARTLFEDGSAERVIACVMTKERGHMHLDTVFTLLDRDKVTIFPKVVEQIRAISLRPGKKAGDFHVTKRRELTISRGGCAPAKAVRGGNRRRPVPDGARAMG